MNKLEVSIELSFDIDAGTIEPFDDVKLNTNRLIHPEVFFERYQNYKMDLKDKAYIDTTAQQVLKIAESVIKNVIKENDGCICDANTNYDCLQTIDLKIGNQHSLWQQLDNVNKFSHDTLKRYDADFLADFARNKLSIDPFKFLKNVPIFEIENMQLYVYMPPVDDFGNLQIGDDRIGYVDVTVEITVITVDMGSEDFNKCAEVVLKLSTKGLTTSERSMNLVQL